MSEPSTKHHTLPHIRASRRNETFADKELIDADVRANHHHQLHVCEPQMSRVTAYLDRQQRRKE